MTSPCESNIPGTYPRKREARPTDRHSENVSPGAITMFVMRHEAMRRFFTLLCCRRMSAFPSLRRSSDSWRVITTGSFLVMRLVARRSLPNHHKNMRLIRCASTAKLYKNGCFLREIGTKRLTKLYFFGKVSGSFPGDILPTNSLPHVLRCPVHDV